MYYQEARDRLINALDQAINEGRWDSSLFFRNILKHLHEIREYVVTELQDEQEVTSADAALIETAARQEQGFQKVYIAIYQARGDRLEGWVNAVKQLGDYYISRSVYQQEDQVREMVRAKRSRNDAYVAVWVQSADILAVNNTQDKLGHSLLTLREGSIKVQNIIEFVHGNDIYRLIDNKLVLNVLS